MQSGKCRMQNGARRPYPGLFSRCPCGALFEVLAMLELLRVCGRSRRDRAYSVQRDRIQKRRVHARRKSKVNGKSGLDKTYLGSTAPGVCPRRKKRDNRRVSASYALT